MGVWREFLAVRVDTVVITCSDSLLVGNWPSALAESSPNVWITTVLPVFASALLSFFAAHKIYQRQRQDKLDDQLLTAFNLYYALCVEMSRARILVWNIINDNNNKRHLRGPFVLDARELILDKLSEVLPPDRNLSTIFRFYELLTLVAVHHNRAASVPDVSGFALLRSKMVSEFGKPEDSSIMNDYRIAGDGRRYAYMFALRNFDMEGEDSLTSLYIEAVEDLRKLAKEVGKEDVVNLEIPNEDERSKKRIYISKKMSKPDK